MGKFQSLILVVFLFSVNSWSGIPIVRQVVFTVGDHSHYFILSDDTGHDCILESESNSEDAFHCNYFPYFDETLEIRRFDIAHILSKYFKLGDVMDTNGNIEIELLSEEYTGGKGLISLQNGQTLIILIGEST